MRLLSSLLLYTCVLAGVLLILAAGAAGAHAQASEAPSAALNGYVRDATTGETLLGANVLVREAERGAATNNAGYYTIGNLAPGTYTVRASYIGYRSTEETVTLEAGEERRLDLELLPDDVALDQVIVEGDTEEADRTIGVERLSTDLIRELPAVLEPDVFRSLQYLPGIKAASDFSSGLYIRGGSPDQTLILLDQTTVYNPSHFFGFFSTFNPDAIKDVQLYKGAFPAEYGGRIGSVVDIYNKDGNRRETRGGLSVGLLASRAYVEGPYGVDEETDSAAGSYMVAVRRSTLEPLLAVLRGADVEGIPDRFYFYDINAKINYTLTDDDRLSLSVYGGQDQLDLEFLDDGQFDISYGNRTASANWTRLVSSRLFTSVTGTASRYRSTPVANIAGTQFTQSNEVTDVSLKADFEYTPTPEHEIKAGLWGGALSFDLRNTFDGIESFQRNIESGYLALFVQDTYRPTDAWRIRGGLRGTYFDQGNFWRLEPRLSVAYDLNPSLRLQAAYGRYYQFLTLESSELFTGFDSWLMTDDGVPPAFGDQWAVGVQTQWDGGWEVESEAYIRTMRDLFEQDPFLPDLSGLPYNETFRFGRGIAYGNEWIIRRNEGPVTGFVAYTLSRTERQFPDVNVNPQGQPNFYVPKFDRTHDLDVVLNYNLSDRWRATATFNYATGQPYTNPQFRYSLQDDPLQSDVSTRDVLVSPFNNDRLPAYHRLDLGVQRTGRFFGLADMELQFQLINAYGRENIWFYLFEFEDDGSVTRNTIPQIPVPLPNVALTLTF
ncbi:MAG: TonB-dependent receptor [Longimonas sp.]|uniref:TonB-dependent receptor n=1 Tax=Longimonas sp. TaxID=2039626 RepID=UPI00335F9909